MQFIIIDPIKNWSGIINHNHIVDAIMCKNAYQQLDLLIRWFNVALDTLFNCILKWSLCSLNDPNDDLFPKELENYDHHSHLTCCSLLNNPKVGQGKEDVYP